MTFEDMKSRVYTVKKPETEPWYPEDLTEVDDTDLGRLLTLYTNWKNFASQQVSNIDAHLMLEKDRLKLREAEEMVKISQDPDLSSTFKAKEDRQAFVYSREDIRELSEKVSLLAAELKLEKAVLEIFESRYAAVSRELTRRQQ